MNTLDEYLGPLHEGVWEVVVPKEKVTEPLGPTWERSAINIPSPGTIASYRNGQYHVHETATEWRVHLDRYDPKRHPVMHLIDDAPLLLMIINTFQTLISESRGKNLDTPGIIRFQEGAWKREIAGGIIVFVLGITIILDPDDWYLGLTQVILPLMVLAAGILLFFSGLLSEEKERLWNEDLVHGLEVLAVGAVLWFIPQDLWDLLFLTLLAIWMVASSCVLISHVSRGKSNVPEGFFSRLIIGFLSLLLAFLIFFMPAGVIEFFTVILGLLLVILGICLISVSFRLKRHMMRYTG